MKLTIGMATYDDFSGVWATIQHLRMTQDLSGCEILVVDNNPGGAHSKPAKDLMGWVKGRYEEFSDPVGTSAPRQHVFDCARGEIVICMDSHVLLAPGCLAALRDWPTQDLLSGPMLYDDLLTYSTHFDLNTWRDGMWGIWACDTRAEHGEPFEIPAMGLGLFACRREAWLGFNPDFRGFGGEEGYIHTKFRQAGRRCLCLPQLRWHHRFGRPDGAPYPLENRDRIRNYIIGHRELGLSLDPILGHFGLAAEMEMYAF